MPIVRLWSHGQNESKECWTAACSSELRPVVGGKSRSVGKEQTGMRTLTRREFVVGLLAAMATRLAPLRLLAASVKPIKIRDLDFFSIEIPVSTAERDAGFNH